MIGAASGSDSASIRLHARGGGQNLKNGGGLWTCEKFLPWGWARRTGTGHDLISS
jgi:hypothetical protein